ncbi:hypothetical protein L249_7950 [Ophiocordyceps polyrhachis-furcata BCC 54312]|uniref:Uncharacterized protein n=1 Tax=Ophiocordyceps polyrhachis-furcata BCC 54312 TaxID=1330021 RepID=A0A367LHJ0_9HYPO|nr:hypothetical protein L249_7950 [Ophiocordyceps polyrhachis-furcata BCC 54312]
MSDASSDFQKFISDARERKRNEALANKIFSRNRRQSAPSRPPQAPGRSLASRVGVNKRASSGSWRHPKGDVDSEWTHDLHDSVNLHRQHASSPRSANRRKGAAQRQSQLASAIDRMDVDQVNVHHANASPRASGVKNISIRGLAGPSCVIAQNFAPGTTAADIESAMTPIGGEMISCSIIKTSPPLTAEMMFSSREGAERVIETFHDKTVSFPSVLPALCLSIALANSDNLLFKADGRILRVYFKTGNHHQTPEPVRAPRPPPRGYRDHVDDDDRSFSRDLIVDDVDDRDDYAYSRSYSRPLYSDKIAARMGRDSAYRRGN